MDNKLSVAVKVLEPSIEIVKALPTQEAYKLIETMGRVSYQSYDHMAPGSAEKFVRMVMRRGHLSLLEHVSVSFKAIVARGVADEIRTHRLTSPIVESTRWCDYTKSKFKREMLFVHYPKPVSPEAEAYWKEVYQQCAESYWHLRDLGEPTDSARGSLDLNIKAQVGMTANLRQLRYMLGLRTGSECHEQMIFVMQKLLAELKNLYPIVFEDIMEDV